MKFCNLHQHSENSQLDGVGTVLDIIKKTAALGHTAAAITDHGNCNNWIQLSNACKENKIKPIFSLEAYFSSGNATEKVRDQKHLILLVKNKVGYVNTLKLNAFAHSEGFYYKPRIDFEILKKHHEGIICLSGCGSGIVPNLLSKGKYVEAKEWAIKFKDLFGSDYYFELQISDFRGQDEINKQLLKLGEKLKIKSVITTDAHYVNEEDSLIQDVMMLIDQKKTWADRKKAIEAIKNGDKDVKLPWEISTKQLWMKTYEELEEARKKWHSYMSKDVFNECLKNTLEIEDKVEKWELDVSPKYPILDFGKKTTNQVLREWIEEGFKIRKIKPTNPVYRAQVEHEFRVLSELGLEAYFVILADAIRYGRTIGIYPGIGRGSAAGSLISYLLCITGADPIQHGLIFERFLNPARKEMPDIDVDFASSKRDIIKDYMVEKYGKDHVVEIASFQSIKIKSALKDVCRVMSGDYKSVNKFTSKMSDRKLKALDAVDEETLQRPTFDESIEVLKDLYPKELQEFLEADEMNEKILGISLRLKGRIRNLSKHPAGVVITPKPINECLALQRHKNNLLSGWMQGVARTELVPQGFVKYDLLSIKTLDIIYDTVKMVKKRHGVSIDIDIIPLDDQKVYAQTKKGRSFGSFQFETPNMQRMLREMRADRFDDLVALNALDRPGPLEMGMDTIYNKLKHDEEDDETREAVKPIMRKLLPSTYGVIVYQEQVLETVKKLANFSLEKADDVRKSVMKRVRDFAKEQARKQKVQQLKKEFIETASKNDVKL